MNDAVELRWVVPEKPRDLELLELELQRRDQERQRAQDRADVARERRRQGRHQWTDSGVLLIGALLAGAACWPPR